jgi:hypothetical protein
MKAFSSPSPSFGPETSNGAKSLASRLRRTDANHATIDPIVAGFDQIGAGLTRHVCPHAKLTSQENQEYKA